MNTPIQTEQHRGSESVNHLMARILGTGMYITFALYSIGILDFFFRGGHIPRASHQCFHSWHQLVMGIYHVSPELFLFFGTIVLILTPISYVVAAIFLFLKQRDFKFVIVTMLVATILVLSIVLGSVFSLNL